MDKMEEIDRVIEKIKREGWPPPRMSLVWRCDGCGLYHFKTRPHCPYCTQAGSRVNSGIGTLAALTFLCLVFLAGVYVGAHTTLGWMVGR